MNLELLDDILVNQRSHWAFVVKELINGRKESHWCWYFFPNVPGLGQSPESKYYALDPKTFEFFFNSTEYRGNLIALIHMIELEYEEESDLELILGKVDALKYRSFMTLLREIIRYQGTDSDFNSLLPHKVQDMVAVSGLNHGVCEHTREAVRQYYAE